MTGDTETIIAIFSVDGTAGHLRELGALLHACVYDGASISFVLPFTQGDEGRARAAGGRLSGA